MAIGPYSINTSPVPRQPRSTLYNAINNYCLNASELLTNQKEIFANCQNFGEINQTIPLTKDNEQQILCLLYSNRIISYCQSKPKQMEYPTLPQVISKEYALPDICKNIVEYSINSIKEFACYHLCTGLADGINPECLFSHYYNNLLKNATLNSTTSTDKITKTSAGNPEYMAVPANKPDASEHVEEAAVSVDKQEKPNQVNIVHGGDSDTIDSNVPKGKQTVVAGGGTSNDLTQPETNVGTEPKPNKLEEHGKLKVEGQSSGNKPPTNGQPPGIQQPIQKPNADQPKSQSEPEKPNTNDVDTSQIENVPVGSQEQEKPKLKQSLEKPEQKQSLEKPEHKQSLEKPLESKPYIKKQVEKVQSTIIDGHPVPSETVDEPKENVNPPKIENGDTDIDDGEGQHDVPDLEDYNAGGNLADDGIPQHTAEEAKEKISEKKPDTLQGNPISTDNIDEIDGESYFLSYFMVVCVLVVLGYVGYHNRIKVMALLLEGKRSRRPYRGRRPNSANYHKLDSNLEEAISSNVTKNSNNVIY